MKMRGDKDHDGKKQQGRYNRENIRRGAFTLLILRCEIPMGAGHIGENDYALGQLQLGAKQIGR